MANASARRRILRIAFVAWLLLSVIYSGWFILRAAWADAITLQTRSDIDQWQRSNHRPNLDEWRGARDTLIQGLEYAPDDPKLYEHLAYLYGLRAYTAHKMPVLYQAFLKQSAIYYVEALKLRPLSPHIWANIAMVAHMSGDRDKMLWPAFDRAMRLGPNEPQVQLTLAEIACFHWENLDFARKSLIYEAIRRANPGLKRQLQEIARRYHLDPNLSPSIP